MHWLMNVLPWKDCRHKIKEHQVGKYEAQNDVLRVDDGVTCIKLLVKRENY